VKRVERVTERVREEVASLISQEMTDPRVEGAVVTRVRMTDDLGLARVYLRMMQGGDDLQRRNAMITALERASAGIRREVGRRVGLRTAPELRFHYDEGQDHAERVDALLAEIELERRSKDPER
jgi:ribosome-binding factor A